MELKINSYNTARNTTSFTGNPTTQFSKGIKFLDKFLKSQENLSTTRFIQGTLTNWFPKAILSRSVVDFSEFTFLEFIESGIFYFAAPLLGEHALRNGILKHVQPKKLQKVVSENFVKSVDEVKNSNITQETKSRLINSKAGAILACSTIPAAEYALGFAKNLFTLKVFKISDFNKVANLDKTTRSKDDEKKAKQVEAHSKKVLKQAGIFSLVGIGLGIALSTFGHKSNSLLKLSEIILEPGKNISKVLHKIGVNSKNIDEFLKEYLKLDFNNNNGKLALSKGQLAVICTTGLFGYSSAAKDRGKLDLYEVLTRVPLVVLYTIFGSSLLDSGFKKILAKKGKFPDLIQKDNEGILKTIPQRKDLPLIAENLAKINGTNKIDELAKLIKQKSVITGIPYLFSLLIMGFTLSGISRLWTQYRYNKQQKTKNENYNINNTAFTSSKNFLS